MSLDYNSIPRCCDVERYEILPEISRCPLCGSKQHVVRTAANIEVGAPIAQRFFCNFCNHEWVETASK